MTRVYFYCREDPHAYQDDVVVLAEGLREIGAEVWGNCDYWMRSPGAGFLVRHDASIGPDDCDIVAVSYGWSRWIDREFRVHERALPESLFHRARRYRTAYLDLEDGYRSCGFLPQYRAFDVVFRAKYNRRCFHPGNHVPWALGLTSRILACTSDLPPWERRTRDLLVNFNASHPYVHPVRALMEKRFIPRAAEHFALNRERDDLGQPPRDSWDLLMWEQTQRRHSRAYFQRLGRSQAVAAFCGELIAPAPFAPPYVVGGRKARAWRTFYEALAVVDPRPRRLIQWDSWRFWEALAAGCLVLNLDLEHYGVALPVMPANFVHYVGVRADDVDAAFQRLQDEPALPARIGSAGRAWAIEHYSPAALARRFVETMLA